VGVSIPVLWRDADWFAVLKPAGVPTTAPPTAGVRSLVDLVREAHAPDATHLHPLSRLDVEVTGVVLMALSPRAIEAGRRARAQGRYQRRYVALLACAPTPERGEWTWPVGIDPHDPKRRVAGGGRDPQAARTAYATLGRAAVAWVAFDLETGRTHQIRVHAQRAGCPVVGDRAYGGPRHVTLPDGGVVTARRVMLHAARVVVPGTARALEAPPPEDFLGVWRACGGEGVPQS
jgi:23S rRNA-/tRNA-specific pseudouridylate synthase